MESGVADLNRADELNANSGVIVWRNHSATFFGKPKAAAGRPPETTRLDDFYGAAAAGTNWSDAVGAFTKAMQHFPSRVGLQCRFAWLLVMCPDEKLRDPSRAVQIAEKAAGLLPQDYSAQLVLGASRYRAGKLQDCIDTINKAVTLPHGGESRAWHFLAMAHQALGDEVSARECFNKGVQWQEKNKQGYEDQMRLRAEAETP